MCIPFICLLALQWGDSYWPVSSVTTRVNFSWMSNICWHGSQNSFSHCRIPGAVPLREHFAVNRQDSVTLEKSLFSLLPHQIASSAWAATGCSPPSSAVSDSPAVLTPSWGTAKGFLDLTARQAAIRLFSWLHTPQTGSKRNEKEGGNRE